MIGQILVTIFLIGMCLEVAREAHVGSWAAKHYTRLTQVPRPPIDWWTERRSITEKLTHRRRWHIDLLRTTRIKELKRK